MSVQIIQDQVHDMSTLKDLYFKVVSHYSALDSLKLTL